MQIFVPEDLIKILIAILIGGIIGLEREIHSKAAGLRTITLITIGATLFTILSARFADQDRVAANIVTGIGFLGAGAILFTEGKVKGLTTASSIWVAASLGMAVGIGDYYLAIITTVVVVIILVLFSRLDQLMDHFATETRTYEISSPELEDMYVKLESIFKECRMRVRDRKRIKIQGQMVAIWELEGRARNHQDLAARLIADEKIGDLKY